MAKKNLVVVAMVAVSCFLFLSVNASAASYQYMDQFEDSEMNSSLWSLFGSSDSNTALSESNGVLNMLSTGAQEESDKVYGSTWTYDLNNSFMATTQFNYSYDGSGGGEVMLGFARLDEQYNPVLSVQIGAARWSNDSNNYFEVSLDEGNNEQSTISQNFLRTVDAGYFGISYDATNDALHLGAFTGSGLAPENLAAGYTIENFKATFGDGPLHAFIGGRSDSGALLMAGDATLDNFAATSAPEPVSSALFLLGGASLAFFRKRNRKA